MALPKRGMVTVKIEGGEALRAKLRLMNPEQNYRIFVGAAMQIGVDIADNAKEMQLLKGDGPVHPTHLTNRSMRLYESIGVFREPLPKAIEVGSEVEYAAKHEHGLNGMKKRSFMAPALKVIEPRIPAIVVRHWRIEAGL